MFGWFFRLSVLLDIFGCGEFDCVGLYFSNVMK